MMSKAKAAEVATYEAHGYTYTAAILEEHGSYNIWIKGKEIPVLLVYVPGKGTGMPKLNFENPRFETPAKGTQKSLAEKLNEMPAAERLGGALDFNGGLNDPLYIKNNVFVEGNRRFARLRGNTPKILAVILPNELTDEELDVFLSTKHLVGPEEWPSFVQSRMAYRFRHTHGWDDEAIAQHCQFTSTTAARKYIGAYVWYRRFVELTGIDAIEQWSKFHHAYVPLMVAHFGYDPETERFDIKSVVAGSLTRIKADDLAGMKTDFKWFCHLISTGRVTDCRESDGLVGPALRAAGDDEEWAERVLNILNTAPIPKSVLKPGGGTKNVRSTTKTTKKNTKRRNGRNGGGELTPAAAAWKQLRDARQDNFLKKRFDEASADIKHIMSAAPRRNPYKADTPENKSLLGAAYALQAELEKIIKILPS